jgi:hypothetical protein
LELAEFDNSGKASEWWGHDSAQRRQPELGAEAGGWEKTLLPQEAAAGFP